MMKGQGIGWLVVAVVLGLAHEGRGAEPVRGKRNTGVIVDKRATPLGDAFATALYGKLSASEGNLAVSPASIESCVLLALAGARGQTATEIAQTLRLSQQDAADIAKLLDRATARLDQTPRHKDQAASLSIANSVWVERGLKIHPAYEKLLEANRRATFETVDFSKDADAAARAINTWVDQETKHKITELLAPGSLSADTKLVLANAIYFKGRWREPFTKEHTKPLPFLRPGQTETKVPTMHRQSDFRYLETDTYQAVELPYAASPYAMVIWLPRKVDGLPALEKLLTEQGLSASLGRLAGTEVNLYLPRFKADSNLSLGDVLTALGMPQAFTPQADFSGICDEPLMISKVVHQALVDVDEAGTEAAAATAIEFLPTSAPAQEEQPPKLFKADHPFAYAIRHVETGDILFVGRVVLPK